MPTSPTLQHSYQMSGCHNSRTNETTPLVPSSLGDNSHDDDSTTSTTSHTTVGRRRRPRALVWTLLLLSLCSFVGMMILPAVPSQQEIDIAAAYDVPLLTHIHAIRNAQDIVDQAHLEYLHDINKDNEHHHHHSDEAWNVPKNCEATILLLRHCDKVDIREHCAYVGYERSVYLATQFGDNPQARWPLPSYVFAERPDARHNRRKYNFREMETVGPLARKAGVKVDDTYSPDTVNQLARKMLTFLQTGSMCGKVAVVSWKHSNIGHLANHLGCGPLQGCPFDYSGKTFDNVWQIKFVYRELDHSNRKNLQLPHKPEWRVFGSVQPEQFDPLAFSKQAGDYPPGGTNHGGRWEHRKVDVPERNGVTDKDAWQATFVGFDDSAGEDSTTTTATLSESKDT